MKASLNFIKDFVKIDETNEELYKLLSFKVIEVEEYYKLVADVIWKLEKIGE